MIETVEAAMMLLLLLLLMMMMMMTTTMMKHIFCSQRTSRPQSHACVCSTTPTRAASSPRCRDMNAEAGREHGRLREAALGEMMMAADVTLTLVPLLQYPSRFPP